MLSIYVSYREISLEAVRVCGGDDSRMLRM